MNSATLKRFTIEEYHRLTELGFLHEDDHVELIRGNLVYMAAKGTPHSVCSTRLNRQLTQLLSDRATVRGQEPITLPSESEPEPDYTIVKNRDDDYLSFHPHVEDILLVIEISDSSLDYDQGEKMSLYAQYEIGNYWIFNLVDTVLEMYSEPYRKSESEYGYRVKRIALSDEVVTLPHFSDLQLNLSIVFPQQS
jgi:Uma2 family endonuclease